MSKAMVAYDGHEACAAMGMHSDSGRRLLAERGWARLTPQARYGALPWLLLPPLPYCTAAASTTCTTRMSKAMVAYDGHEACAAMGMHSGSGWWVVLLAASVLGHASIWAVARTTVTTATTRAAAQHAGRVSTWSHTMSRVEKARTFRAHHCQKPSAAG